MRAALALSLGAGALALAGCGGVPDGTADVQAGKELFTGAGTCGSCHVLADAGTTGRIGPNLDDAFRGARQQGWDESQIHAVTREWIALAQPPMPRDLVTGQDAENVAAYVAEVAGRSPVSVVRPPQPEAGGGAPEPGAAGGPTQLEEGDGEPGGSGSGDPGGEGSE